MSNEEKERYYGLDPRAGLWQIWSTHLEAKERSEEIALLLRASMRPIDTSDPGKKVGGSIANRP